jgi:hypothetical protein
MLTRQRRLNRITNGGIIIAKEVSLFPDAGSSRIFLLASLLATLYSLERIASSPTLASWRFVG